MFDSLQKGLLSAFKTLRGKGKLTAANMSSGLSLVERSLLDADVQIDVVNDFMKRVSAAAMGEKVLLSLRPDEQLLGIVHQELIEILGPVTDDLSLKKGVNVWMLCGLQGAGKTTTCGKLASLQKRKGKSSLLVAADLQRPAAIEQLHVIGDSLDIPVFSDRTLDDPVEVCKAAVAKAKRENIDIVILDTAGRLAIDKELMTQLQAIDRKVQPDRAMLVVDGMTGQDAVRSASEFDRALDLDGVIMTKLDGDTRGGALLSVKHVTGVPVRFIGSGEGLEDLEPFRPEGMAGRILGQGDMLQVFEEAKHLHDAEERDRLAKQLEKGQFTLSDFRTQLKQVANPGKLKRIMKYLPGGGKIADASNNEEIAKAKKMIGMIDSMTEKERVKPKVIDQSRRRRIAEGAGSKPNGVKELVSQYRQIQNLMSGLATQGVTEQIQTLQNLGAELDGQKTIGSPEKKKRQKRLSPLEKKQAKKIREKKRRKRR